MNVFIKTTTNNHTMNIQEEEFRYINYNSAQRKENSIVFNETILPELKKLYKHELLNKISHHNRFRNGKNIVDYFPLRKRLGHINKGEWFTVDEDEYIMSRIVFLLNRK